MKEFDIPSSMVQCNICHELILYNEAKYVSFEHTLPSEKGYRTYVSVASGSFCEDCYRKLEKVDCIEIGNNKYVAGCGQMRTKIKDTEDYKEIIGLKDKLDFVVKNSKIDSIKFNLKKITIHIGYMEKQPENIDDYSIFQDLLDLYFINKDIGSYIRSKTIFNKNEEEVMELETIIKDIKQTNSKIIKLLVYYYECATGGSNEI